VRNGGNELGLTLAEITFSLRARKDAYESDATVWTDDRDFRLCARAMERNAQVQAEAGKLETQGLTGQEARSLAEAQRRAPRS
jgi:hypothetical protein